MAKVRKAEKRPPLNKKHKIKCQDWAKKYLKTDFSKVLWTDEMRVTLDGPDGWARGWISKGQRAPLRLRRQQGGGGVLVWPGIFKDELVGPFRVEDGVKLNSQTYCQFLEDNFFKQWYRKKSGIVEELGPNTRMTLQNRLALDMILAEKGGVCEMVGEECCTYIPQNSRVITKATPTGTFLNQEVDSPEYDGTDPGEIPKGSAGCSLLNHLPTREKHFRSDRIPQLNHKYYTQWFHGSNSDSKSKGVSIALHKSLQAQVVASKADSDGRYVFLKLKIAHDLFTIANIYLPNQDQVRACRKYLRDLSAFAEGYVIMGGDFNMVLDCAVDSTLGRSAVSLSQLERLRRALTDSRFCILYIRSMSRVAKTIKRYKETGSYEDRPRKGRPRATSASEDKFIRVTSLRNRRLTEAQIRDQTHLYNNYYEETFCVAGLHGKTAARKPLLRTGNKQKRLVWAKEHKEWTLDQWKSVLWFDESKFDIFGSNHRVFVRCRKGERMDSTCLVPTVKHGGGGVIDNDPKHTSRLCKGYLTKKDSDGVLRQMTWPPQSPDLNPIKMVWGELDSRVKANGLTSAKYLWELLQDCWKTIPSDYLLKLIKRMPRVCKAVIKAKGGYFEEPRI
ncbi:unnamed protein product [Ranitomeya imitator]|uniref:Transposase n=1 Tax=Ranitomeya imitator TaxID=111125 RepID=A0ABN9MNS2_9NEOB|nr:unnamed protein product [Ranitomeya imitator]